MLFSGVAVASVTEPDLRGLETAVVRALWGATRLSRAKEIIFTVLSKGHRVSPVMHTRYERLLWLARVARRPGVTQVFTQAIWESGGRPPVMGPVGCVLRTVATLGWSPREGWWCWDVPGQEHPLHFVQEPLRQLQQRVRDSLRCHSRSPSGEWVTGQTAKPAARQCGPPPPSWRSRCCAASWLRPCGQRPGCRATACGPLPREPHCGAAHEDVVHVLWDCPEWESARETWRPWLSDVATVSPHLGPPDQWPSPCGRGAYSPSGWRKGWTGDYWAGSCTGFPACT